MNHTRANPWASAVVHQRLYGSLHPTGTKRFELISEWRFGYNVQHIILLLDTWGPAAQHLDDGYPFLSRGLLCKTPVLNLSSAKLKRDEDRAGGEKREDKYVTETGEIIKYENMKEALLLLKLHLKFHSCYTFCHSHQTALTMVLFYPFNLPLTQLWIQYVSVFQTVKHTGGKKEEHKVTEKEKRKWKPE